jgi:23S rRNA pseudouridine1911/1915/1917 synthase
MAVRIDILIDDPAFLAVNKPADVLTIPGRQGGESICDLLTRAGVPGELRLVHRLDRGTSGVLLLARDLEAQRALSEQFLHRRVEKTYLALVRGVPEGDEGLIEAPLTRDPNAPTRMVVHAKRGKHSQTRWQVLERFFGIALVRCHPLTGRQHQIRVHLAHVGMPLLVDGLYGQSDTFFLSSVKPGYKHGADEERPLIARLTLHAESVSFAHPRTSEPVRIEAPLPKDFRATLAQLRKLRRPNDRAPV